MDSSPDAPTPRDASSDAAERVVQGVRRVWEEKAVGLIYDHYQHNVRIHTAFGDRYGRDDLVTDAVEQLAAFPDLRLYGEDVILDEERGYVSHRAIRIAHNTGYSVFGRPTGKRVRYRTVTDYLVRGERIAETWTVHDGLAVVRQLGLGVAEAVGAITGVHPLPPLPHGVGEPQRLRGQNPPDSPPRPLLSDGAPGDGVKAFVAWVWHELWNRRRFDRVAELYAPDYRFFGPSGTRLGTRDGFTAYALGLLAAFPDATVQLERLSCVGSGTDWRVAVRWRLFGTHDGPSRYGAPTGRRVNVLGITHHRLHGETFGEEWTVFDELALLAQLYAPDGSGVPPIPSAEPPLFGGLETGVK